jgi:DeoR family suf operon transcriptional repressor
LPSESEDLEGLTSTREAVLNLLLRHGESTAASIASTLHVSVQVMRRHLRSLELDGLVEANPTAVGPGRPINRWCLTELGRARFPDNSDSFALGLLQSMAASLPPETIRLLMRQQAIEKAAVYRRKIGRGDLRERLERLVDLRREEGYAAELQSAPDGLPPTRENPPPPNSWVISEFHCSVIRIAEEFPMVCDQELQMIRHTFPDCQVDRVHWRLQEGHSCGFLLSPLPSHELD